MALRSNSLSGLVREHLFQHMLAYQIAGILMATVLVLGGSVWLTQTGIESSAETMQAEASFYEDDAPRHLSAFQERQILNEILENAIAAQGGRIFVERLQTVKKLGALTQNESTMEVVYAFKRPNRVRYRMEENDRGFRIGYDGTRAWIQSFASGRIAPAQTLSDEDALSLVLTTELALPAVLFFDESQYITYLGIEEVGGYPCHVLAYFGPLRAGQRFYIDTEDHVLRKRSRQARFRDENDTVVEVVYREFRLVDGILIPHHEDVYFDGKLETSFAISEYVLNPGILDQYFQMPGES